MNQAKAPAPAAEHVNKKSVQGATPTIAYNFQLPVGYQVA